MLQDSMPVSCRKSSCSKSQSASSSQGNEDMRMRDLVQRSAQTCPLGALPAAVSRASGDGGEAGDDAEVCWFASYLGQQ